jgi:predicted nucleic acid-binding protein
VDAVDTGVLIWGVRKEPAPDRPDLVERCIHLIETISNRTGGVMIPSIVLSEYLVGLPFVDQARSVSVFKKHFFVAPFDAKAAEIAAEIYSRVEFGKIKAQSNQCRQCVKADIKIIATAIAHGAARIYTDDDHFRSMACGKILVENIPEIPPQQTSLLH